MHGTPVFRGTRVPAQTLFDYIEGGETLEDFLEGFPTVSRDLALQALEEAKHLLLAHAGCGCSPMSVCGTYFTVMTVKPFGTLSSPVSRMESWRPLPKPLVSKC
jgi:uncharacterized protein (DUF433 family)